MSTKILIDNVSGSLSSDSKQISLPLSLGGETPAYSSTSGWGSYSSGLTRNRIINGAMTVNQRGSTVTSSGGYPVDRWFISSTIAGFEAKPWSWCPPGFSQSLSWFRANSSSISSSDYIGFAQRIEGVNVSDLAWGTPSAKPVTISFWAYSNVGGTYSFALRNSIANKMYVTTYTLTANVWEKKSITIPGDTSAVASTDNSIGVTVWFTLASGTSNETSSLNAWQSGTIVSSTTQTDVVSIPNSTWYVTGVQLEVGSIATPFELRPYQIEHAMCQRYFARIQSVSGNYNSFAHGATNNSLAEFILRYPQEMRSSPTISTNNLVVFLWSVAGPCTLSTIYYGNNSALITASTSGSHLGTSGLGSVMLMSNNTTSAWIDMNAEL